MTIHIEGMGVLGSQVAWELEELGVKFTWNDTETDHTAWHCSTGIVYPSGAERDMAGLEAWHSYIDDDRPLGQWAARSNYLFAHKNPPHGGRYPFEPATPKLRVGHPYAVAVNVPDLVRETRETFKHRRTEGTAGRGPLVVAHATPGRLDGYLWGWCARVRFDEPYPLGEGQSTYYAKAHRFNLTYAYPIPGTGQWWAGSSLVHQKRPAERAIEPYLAEWIGNAEKLLGITGVQVDSMEQGWRPRRAAGEENYAQHALVDGRDVYTLAPEPTSGVRHGPHIVADLLERMGL